MTQAEALSRAQELNEADGAFGNPITHIAQDADGGWHGFADKPTLHPHGDEWQSTYAIELDRKWNDEWRESLAEVPQ